LNYFNYFSEIEDTFIRRRGKILMLSPLDWALMETWQEREIPLHIVLRAIEQVFDNHEKSNKKRTIKGLTFCREEIEAQHEEWLESQVGKQTEQSSDAETDETFTLEGVTEHIADVISALQNAINPAFEETFTRIIGRLNELKNTLTDDFEKVEASLAQIEKILDEELKRNAGKLHLTDIEQQLSGYKKSLDKETYQKTFDLMLLKRLRDEHEIPRLSLFYL
jgi:hypothetical protein